MKVLSDIGVIPFLIATYFILYVLLLSILGPETASRVKTLLLIVISFLMISKSSKKNYYYEYITPLMFCFFGYFIINVIFFRNSEIIKWFINVNIFYIFFKYSNFKCFEALSFAIKILSLICSTSVITVSIKNGFMGYYRDEVLIDKSYFTIFYGMTYFLCILDYLYDRKKIYNIIILFFALFVNVFFVQSKTSLLALVVELIVLYVFFPNIRSKYNKYLKYVIVIGPIIFFSIPSIHIDDGLAYGINRVTGLEIFEESSFVQSDARLSMTFDVRNDVKDYCFDLFSENPIFGIGQGGFSHLNKVSFDSFSWLGETESTWLQILTEGGIFYLSIMIFFFYKPLFDTYKKLKSDIYIKSSYCYLIAFSFFLIYFVMFFFNDFTDSLFWISAGIMTSLIVCDKTDISW